jgi:hypothetical protein
MKEKKDIQFAFMGDIMLGGEFLPFAERHGVDILALFNLIDSYLKGADIVVRSLEGPIFQGVQKREGVPTLLQNHPSSLIRTVSAKDIWRNLRRMQRIIVKGN